MEKVRNKLAHRLWSWLQKHILKITAFEGKGLVYLLLDPEKAEVLNDLYISVFNGKCSSQAAQDRKGKWEYEDPKYNAEDNQVQDHLKSLNILKCMGPDEIDLWVLRELAGKLQSYYQSFLKTCGTQVKFPTPGKRKI